MVLDERVDEVVRVVVLLLHSDGHRVPSIPTSRSEVLGLQLVVEEVVRRALVDQNGHFGTVVFLHQLSGVPVLASLH